MKYNISAWIKITIKKININLYEVDIYNIIMTSLDKFSYNYH